ncbi:MFS transporter [Salininema proteolyticum]|uniref:MFS transporter n=1 Tax=Salininema proteolyticum TaxID=1607685 RepID=A0ABV8TY07_9ACTN
MANPYSTLFKAPGTVAFSAAGFLARLPMAMGAIAIIAMVSQLRGGYGLAGAVSATFTLSMAVCAPQISRLVDRYGQSKVLPPFAGASVAAFGVLVLCARYDAPAWTLFACAAIAGALPNMSAMVRSRWTHLYRGQDRLHTAFSLESVVDELTYMVGPAVAVTLSTALFPEAAPVLAAVLLAIGVALFVPQKRTEPPLEPRQSSERNGAAIRSRTLVMLALTLFAGGTIVGTVDVVSVAFAEEQGFPAGAGIVLGVYAAGSALSGLVFGAWNPSVPLPRLLIAGTAGTALTTVPLFLADGLIALSTIVFIAGVFFSPTMITVMGLVENTVPAAQLTEGMTWVITGLSAGAALGAGLSGAVVDAFGPVGGFTVAVTAGAATFAFALAAYRPLSAATAAEPEPVAG